ncbi:MAG: hypothetical protein A2Y67_04160 [Candidatus Buchananbacteria bacterium RBG_13_39_9]|uniref:Lipoprotein signal peptidase n=1 Tax=Candidatus Buchananbacteria bacterium RBG_13_39_9 TaxID=1797531 RepID=A0A1G1XQC0_9BACT|nr:MAG: hypothetical protein A2Y67_04160 [Candidatus Buchananbacteria bacterium RBG_13_39_9]
MGPKPWKIILIILSSLSFLILESIIKYSIVNKIPDEGFYLIPKILQIIYVPNYNIAFSLPLPKILILIIVVIILFILSYFWWINLVEGNCKMFLANSLLIIGAFSNFLDRILYGYVIDYINISIWPIFNLADCLIVAGIGIYAIIELRRSNNKTH